LRPDHSLAIALLALLLEAAAGYPDRLFRAVGHPVVWIGQVVAWTDRHFNRLEGPPWRGRAAGILALVPIVLLPAGLAFAIQCACFLALPHPLALVLLGVLAASLPAQRSLHAHVAAVVRRLEHEGLAGGREAVSRIVGRDPASLDAPAVARAAIESLAENFSDGVVAPLFWCALFGLPGIVAYKAINTADSMIGHRTARHERFGWAAARLDDLVNLPASRLSAAWLIAVATLSGRGAAARRAVRRDAPHHRSPNAGWPEAAMAGALGLRLAGPRRYGGQMVEDRWMGDGRADADAADIGRALRFYRRACTLQALVVGGLALLAG